MVSSALADRSYRPSPQGFSLEPAAAQLYAAFAPLPLALRVPHCPHCVSDADVAALQARPSTLSPELVSRFVRKTGTTWGGTNELRRVTPRILTLAADHRLNVSRSLVWQKLRAARWTDWPDAEVDAIGRFVLAEFTRLLRVPPRPAHVAHRWLAQVSTGIDDLSGFLTVWHDSMGPLPDPSIQVTAVGHLVELLTSSPLRPDLPATLIDVFPQNPRVASQVSGFLMGPGTDLDLRRAASDLSATPSARRINVAVERLRRFRAANGGETSASA
ncbi:hypothetical protein ACE2AJ_04745 [Aquihabitans daechungensis]|uniref:hypothetical protein n=1 Tax=Aquihabitans daechungensis TaxID=1052257 RepID=UPI003BA1E978